MPVMVIAAVAGYAATAAAVAAGIVVAGGIGAALIGMAASFVVSAVLSPKPSSNSQDADDGGVASAVSLEDRLVTVRQSIAPWQIIYGEARVGGVVTYMESVQYNKDLHMVITLAGHEVESIGSVWANEELLVLDPQGYPNGGGYSVAHNYTDLLVAKSPADGANQPFATLVGASEGKWTTAHLQQGRAKMHIKLVYNPDFFPNGIPNFTALVRGRKVYDPRSGITAWSVNPALCVADFMTNNDFGFGAIYDDEIDEAALITAANICDEQVLLASGGYESRYTMNGAFKTNSTPKEILGRMLSAMIGNAVFIGGRWKIYAGGYVTPTVTLTADDLRGPIHTVPRLSRRDICNGVKGVFVSPDNSYQPSDFPPVTNALYTSEDQGERIWRDIDLPFTNSSPMAQRLAKIELERTRQQMVVELQCKLTAYTIQPGDTVMLTLPRYGWAAKVFEVKASKLTFEANGSGGIVIGVDHVLRETAAASYTWTYTDETVVDLAPDTNLPDPFTFEAPGAPSIVETLYETTGSAGVKSQVTVSWVRPNADAQYYVLEYKLSADSTWTVLPSTTSSSMVLFDLEPANYDFRVKAVSYVGISSAYASSSHELVGLIAPPSDVTGFTVVATNGFAYASWAAHADLDVKIGGKIEIGHSPLTTGATWANAIMLKQFAGNAVTGVVSLITGTYMAKAIDSTGHYSENAVHFVATEGMVTGFTTVGTLTEDPTFADTKVNVAVVSSKLQLSTGSLFDSASGNFDSQSGMFDAYGGQAITGSYTFGPLDLTTVAVRRFEADIKAAAVNNSGDLFDSGQGLFDSADGLFDGEVVAINDANVILHARMTNDDPAVAPTWGEWFQFHVADMNCRGAEFRLDFEVDTPSHNIAVEELRIHAKEAA